MSDKREDSPVWSQCPFGIRHEQQIDEIQRRMNTMEGTVTEIRDKLLARPSWLVTIALTGLCTLSTALTVYIITH